MYTWCSLVLSNHFLQHVKGTRHRKFAQNDANYVELDILLHRLQRKAKHDVVSQPEELESDHEEPAFRDDASEEGLNLSDDCLIPGDYFYVGRGEKNEDDEDEEAGIEGDGGSDDEEQF
jgi:regulatory subunit for Cdc7p protein kinase